MQVVGSGQSSITFSSIPATCTDLEITSCISTALGNDDIYMQFNGDSGLHYDRGFSFGGQTVLNGSDNGIDHLYVGNTGANNICKATFIIIPSYLNTNTQKSIRSLGMSSATGGSAAILSTINAAGSWESTAAINQIVIYLKSAGNTFNSSTIITLRGK